MKSEKVTKKKFIFSGLERKKNNLWLFDVDRSVSMTEKSSTIELLGYTLVASFQNVSDTNSNVAVLLTAMMVTMKDNDSIDSLCGNGNL